MKGMERVSTARKNVAATTPSSTNSTSRRRFCVALIVAGPEPPGTKMGCCDDMRRRTRPVTVRPTERRELVVEVPHRVGSALLPASPEDRRHEHRDPENAQNQDDRNRQGKRPRLCRPKSECNRLLATRCGSQPPTARFAAVSTLAKCPGAGRGRASARVRDRGRRRGPRRAGGRCRNARRSSPRAPDRRSSCSGRSTCTCRRSSSAATAQAVSASISTPVRSTVSTWASTSTWASSMRKFT